MFASYMKGDDRIATQLQFLSLTRPMRPAQRFFALPCFTILIQMVYYVLRLCYLKQKFGVGHRDLRGNMKTDDKWTSK
jgi:hypothetical protein